MSTLEYNTVSGIDGSYYESADLGSHSPAGGHNRATVQSIPTVSVVIPALNEARNIPSVFSALPRNLHQVILVDGGSTDDTVEVANKLRRDLCVVQQTRKGKGNALACGFEAATGDIIVMLDADGSTDPGEIPLFIEALTTGNADFAKGTRFLEGGGSADITMIRSWGNWILMLLANLFCRSRFSDLCYGYNAFWARCLPVFDLDPGNRSQGGAAPMTFGDGFEIETLLNIRAAKSGLKIKEVPSFEKSRLHGQSNLKAIPDGIRVIKTILRESRRSRAAKLAPVVAGQRVTEERLGLSA